MSNVADPIVGPHMAGWFWVNGERRYFYGLGVPADYTGPIPEGFEVHEIPGSYYAVFFHPAFDYLSDNAKVMERVEEMAWNFDDHKLGSSVQRYTWNEDCSHNYQCHYPEVRGYAVYRPIKRVL